MSKKMMMLALAVASVALFALPAIASAQSAHLDQTSSFSVTGNGGTLTGSVHITCSSTEGSGVFSTTTAGTVSLKLTGCKENIFNQACKTPGSTTETIDGVLNFHYIMANSTASTKDPGVLLTPHSSLHPTSASSDSHLKSMTQITELICIGISVKVIGTGVIGTLSPSVCSVPSETATLTFESSSTGNQKDLTWTGNTYDLRSGTSHVTSSTDGVATLHFPGTRTTTCT